MGGEILLLDSVSVLRFIEYRYHSCGGLSQIIAADFVETDEFVTRCEELLHLVQRLVENETKVCYNNFTGMIVRR